MFYSQTDGLTEHKNQWVKQYLHLVTANNEEWSNLLPLAMLVYNNSANSMTRLTPNQLLIGRELSGNTSAIRRNRKPPGRVMSQTIEREENNGNPSTQLSGTETNPRTTIVDNRTKGLAKHKEPRIAIQKNKASA